MVRVMGVVTGSVANCGASVSPPGAGQWARAVFVLAMCFLVLAWLLPATTLRVRAPRQGLGLVAGVAGGLPGPGDGVQDVLGWDTLQPRQPQPCTGSVPLPNPPRNIN